MKKLEMNLENIEPIVSPNDPDFLRHSNSALREELEKIKKELEIMKLYSLYWSERATKYK
jgi:hypothetical protein|tara:strand:- start:135 stop:314 length:180 start_codon:yes stop_codon:yes gene_type:complete